MYYCEVMSLGKKRVGEIFKVKSRISPCCENVLNSLTLSRFDLDWYMLDLNSEGGEYYGTR